MYSLDEAHQKLDSWVEGGCVGNLIFYHPPHSDEVDCFVERTIKLREMESDERNNLIRAFNHMRFERAEIFSDSSYNLDRIKVVRRY